MPGYGQSDFRGISRIVNDYHNQIYEPKTAGDYISKSQARRYEQLQGNLPIVPTIGYRYIIR